MIIHKTLSFVDKYRYKGLDTQLNELTNENSLKVPKVKVVKPTNKKTLLKTLGISVINC